MVEARQDADKNAVADNAAEMSRFAETTARLFAEQANAMAVMTVYGLRAASEMTSMMLGALRGQPMSSEPAESVEREPMPSTAKIVPLRTSARVTTIPAPAVEAVVAPATTPAAKARKTAAPKAPSAAKAAKKPARAGTEPAKAGDRDDLKKISGLGPRLEQVLNERGIVTYADLAAMSKAALKKLDGELDLEGRVMRDDWAGQAKALSEGKG